MHSPGCETNAPGYKGLTFVVSAGQKHSNDVGPNEVKR
jgi:hypothetical protein